MSFILASSPSWSSTDMRLQISFWASYEETPSAYVIKSQAFDFLVAVCKVLFSNWSKWTGLVHFRRIRRMRRNQHSLQSFNFDWWIFNRTRRVMHSDIKHRSKNLIKSVVFGIFVARMAQRWLEESTLFSQVNLSCLTNSASRHFATPARLGISNKFLVETLQLKSQY